MNSENFRTNTEEGVRAPSKGRYWASQVLTAIPILFLLMDAVMKFAQPKPVIDSFARLGYPLSVSTGLGIVLLACTVLLAIPRTAVFGAVLLTGYLGGAVATHVRVGDPLFSHVLFPVYLGALIWGGLYLRDERVQAMVR